MQKTMTQENFFNPPVTERSEVSTPAVGIIVWMVILHLIAFYAVATSFSWHNLGIALLGYFLICCFGINIGYHRYFTHRSFKARTWFERVLAVLGVLNLQGGPLMWVAHHRMHHSGSDTERDPHDSNRGFWYSHLLWMLRFNPKFDTQVVMKKYARDIAADPFLMFLENPIVQIGLTVMLGLGLWVFGSFELMLWGLWVRLVITYHCTWFVNSATHKWGYRNYNSEDASRNLWWVAIVSWGEGWHNNHHTYERVAAAGHKWWEIDTSYIIIKLLAALSVVWDIQKIPKEAT